MANMRHGLRTPLNAVLGFAQILEGDAHFGEVQRAHPRDIRRGGERLLSMINEVLDLARIEAGRIDSVPVESTLGEGSTFRLRVPVRALSLQERPMPAQRTPRGALLGYRRTEGQGPLRIPVVDDEAQNRVILRRLLERLGFAVDEAQTGAQCIEQAEVGSPDLILMDLCMPEMDGVEATHPLRAMPAVRDIPVVAVTAAAFDADRARLGRWLQRAPPRHALVLFGLGTRSGAGHGPGGPALSVRPRADPQSREARAGVTG
jgi:CheY-like chemotaxis protein